MTIKFAINPIQWSATSDGWIDSSLLPPLPQLLEAVHAAGFRAVHTERPPDLRLDEYQGLLHAAGLEPAPGYFSLAPTDDPDHYLAAARAIANDHALLGVHEVFVSIRMVQERIAAPARGARADLVSIPSIATALNHVGQAMGEYGVALCLHPHVGSWIEMEEEIERVIDLTDPTVVALGPDTGHLAWAGVDPVAFTRRHAPRIRALHLKDIKLDVARSPSLRDADYRTVVAAGLWAEPGRGDLDLAAVLEALTADFDGWAVVEVDRPRAESPAESAQLSAAWIQAHA